MRPMANARKRYPPEHWARAEPSEQVLARYLAGFQTAYNRTKIHLFESLLGRDLRGVRILDYGGGAGYLAVRCARRGARVTLVDAERNALRTAGLLAERAGVSDRLEFVESDSFPPALRRRRFDIVLMKDVVEHIEDDEALLHDLAACQDSGGRLVLSTQSTWSLNYLLEGTYHRWWSGDASWCGWDPTHLRFYTPGLLARRLRRAGYRPQHWHGLFIVPYNILSWLVLLKKNVVLDALRYVDLWLGGVFPFNRLGWNVILAAERRRSAG